MGDGGRRPLRCGAMQLRADGERGTSPLSYIQMPVICRAHAWPWSEQVRERFRDVLVQCRQTVQAFDGLFFVLGLFFRPVVLMREEDTQLYPQLH